MFLAAWKAAGMLVLAVNAGVVFTLDVHQCSFSCMDVWHSKARAPLPFPVALTLPRDTQQCSLVSAPALPCPGLPSVPCNAGTAPGLGQEKPFFLAEQVGFAWLWAQGGGDRPWCCSGILGEALPSPRNRELNLAGRGRGNS